MLHLMENAPMLKLFLTPAEEWNARYKRSESDFVTLKDRIQNLINLVPIYETELEHSEKIFWNNNPNIKVVDIKLARAATAKLSQIKIDDTMNRPLNWEHVRKIIENFKDTRVLAINVYEDPNEPGFYIAWDGQHTAIVLYLIFVKFFGQSASKIDIPVVIANSNDKATIRENFIILNTEESDGGGKVNLSPLDKYSQMVYGVEVDKNLRNPKWNEIAKKQRLLESAHLFLTQKEFQNTNKTGAITHVKYIFTEPVDRVANFCTYWIHRPGKKFVDSKEVEMIFEFFRKCDDAEIKVSKDFIKDMTAIFYDNFECEFSGDKGINIFWKKLDVAYKNWYNQTYPAPKKKEPDLRPKLLKMTENGKHQLSYGVAFMIQLLLKYNFKHELPQPTQFKKNAVLFVAAEEDIW